MDSDASQDSNAPSTSEATSSTPVPQPLPPLPLQMQPVPGSSQDTPIQPPVIPFTPPSDQTAPNPNQMPQPLPMYETQLPPLPVEEPPLTIRDLMMELNDTVRCVLSPENSIEDKKAMLEKMRNNIEDFFIMEAIGDVAKASVQMFQTVFSETNAVSIESPLYALRKIILDFVIRFVPADLYKCSSRVFEDILYRSLPLEYEGNALLMLKYLNDSIRYPKNHNYSSLLTVISEIHSNINGIIAHVRADTKQLMFEKMTFNSNQLQDLEYMQTVVSNLYFETPLKMLKAPMVVLNPPVKNSVKLIVEFINVLTFLQYSLRDRIAHMMPEIIQTIINFLSLEINMADEKVHVDFAAVFFEVQIRMLAFLAYQLRNKSESSGQTLMYSHLVIPHTKQIVRSIRVLLRNLPPYSILFRKDLLLTIKQLCNTDVRRELLDVVPDLCYEELITGPSCLIPVSLRSDLYIVNFDIMHVVRTSLDWTTFQHVFMHILRTSLDYTLTSYAQAVNWKIVINMLDACHKAEDAVYTQLTVGFNYDSARVLYETTFFALCHKYDVLVNDCVEPFIESINNQNTKKENGKFAPSVEVYAEGQSSDEESDDDSLGSEYEPKTNVFDEIDPVVELNSDQEDAIDEIFVTTQNPVLDEDGKFFVDGQQVFEDLRIPTKAYPLRFSKQYQEMLDSDKQYEIDFTRGSAMEPISSDDESDPDDDVVEGHAVLQQNYFEQSSTAVNSCISRDDENEADLSDELSDTSFDEENYQHMQDRAARSDLRLRLPRFEADLRRTSNCEIAPLTRPERNFSHCINGIESVIPKKGKYDPEKSSVQMAPKIFPYDLADLKCMLRNQASCLKIIMTNSHFTDELKSPEPSPQFVQALSTLMKNFISSLELLTIVTVGTGYGFTSQTMLPAEDKDYIDCFISVFHNMHPAIFERIFRQHVGLFFDNSLRSSFIHNILFVVTSAAPLHISTTWILTEFIMDNPEYAYNLDDDDSWRYQVFQRSFKAVLHFLSTLATSPYPYGFEARIQKFFYQFTLGCIRHGISMLDPLLPIHSLRSLFRHTGSPLGSALYQLFFPLFPSFLSWMSQAQNVVSNESIQDNFIEMCLSLPTRLSSLIVFMPLIAEPAVNSFINAAKQASNMNPQPQGWRTLELCLDNYYSGNVKEFFGKGFSRILESLYEMTNSDGPQTNLVFKMLSHLNGLNRGSAQDVQKLIGKCTFEPSLPCLRMVFERSGKQIDSVITDCYKLVEMAEPPIPSEVIFINSNREKLHSIQDVHPETKPLSISIPLQPMITECVNLIKSACANEGQIQKAFNLACRGEALLAVLHFVKRAFSPTYSASNRKIENDTMHRMAMLNLAILSKTIKTKPTWEHPEIYKHPWRCEDKSIREFHVSLIVSLLYGSANPDFHPVVVPFLEDTVDFLTMLAHLENGFDGEQCKEHHGLNAQVVDSFVIVDALYAVIQDRASSRLLNFAIKLLKRMIQTGLSFSSDYDTGLNVPFYHYLLSQICDWCAESDLVTRNGAIMLLEKLVEIMPITFLHAGFKRILDAVFDVLHFGDDDITEGCNAAAIKVGGKLLDRVLCDDEREKRLELDSDDSDDSDSDDYNYHPMPRFIITGLKHTVFSHLSTTSHGTSQFLCTILSALTVDPEFVAITDFRAKEITQAVSNLMDSFYTTSFQHRIIIMKLIKHLILVLPKQFYLEHFLMPNLTDHVKLLILLTQCSNEEVIAGPNYATCHLQLMPSTILPVSSNILNYQNGMNFIDRVMAFRKELAGYMTVLAVHLAQSVLITEVSVVPITFDLETSGTIPYLINLMFSAHLSCAKDMCDDYQAASIEAVQQMLIALNMEDKESLIQELLEGVADCSSIHQIHLLAVVITDSIDFSIYDLDQILMNPNNLFVMFSEIAKYGPEEVKMFKSFLDMCHRAKIPHDDDVLTPIFYHLAQTRVLNAFTLNEADFFSPMVRFLGGIEGCYSAAFDWFIDVERIQQDNFRQVFKILISHPDGDALRALWMVHDTKIIDLLLHHMILSADAQNIMPPSSYIAIDEMMIFMLLQFCETFPHIFVKRSNFTNVIIRFLLSRHFRSNYLILDHGLDSEDNLKLTPFTTNKALVPECCVNMLINTVTLNPYDFNTILCLCLTLPQVYFNETSKLRLFFDNFLVQRMTLHWRRSLLRFVIEKLQELFTEPIPTNTEDLNSYNFMQVGYGNLMNYVLYPTFSYAFERFIAAQVLNAQDDDVMLLKDNWEDKIKNREPPPPIDMAKEYCTKVLSLYNDKIDQVRPELAHGILQFVILLMQRASASIHEPGVTVQSSDLQNVMQAAWPATNGTGIFSEKSLRSVGMFLLAVVMSSVTIKKDIILQLFDTVVAMPDARESPILKKTLFTLSSHAARRKDDCFLVLVERVRLKLIEDGFNTVKIGNTLSMLANNYEDFFAARFLLSPTILFAVHRIQVSKLANMFVYLHDAVTAIVGWEEMRLMKSNLFKPTSTDERCARIAMDPAMKPLEHSLLDATAALVIKLAVTSNDPERIRKVTPIFHKALHPRVLGRNMFAKFDKTLAPRDYDLNSTQYNNMISQIHATTKTLNHFVGTAPLSSVYCFTVALQHVAKPVINTNHASLMDCMVSFIVKVLEVCHDAEPVDRTHVRDFIPADKRFVPLYSALADYTYKVSIRFAARPTLDFHELSLLFTMLKSVTGSSDYAYKLLIGPDVIDVGSRMVNVLSPVYNNETDRYKHDLIITLFEIFTAKAELLTPENTSLFLHNVAYKLLTRFENLPAKYCEPVCRFLNASVTKVVDSKSLNSVSRQHMSVIGAVTRHHILSVSKYQTLLTLFLDTVVTLFKDGTDFSSDFTEVWLAFYTGLSCSYSDVREKFLNVFETRLPETFFERLIFLLTSETWSLMPGNSFIGVIVNMLYRCVLNNNRRTIREPDAMDDYDPQRVVPESAPKNVFIEPQYVFRAPVQGFGADASNCVNYKKLWPVPADIPQYVKESRKAFWPKNLQQICTNYIHHNNNAQHLLDERVEMFIKMIHRLVFEGDVCLFMFEELIPAIWTNLTQPERELLTEVMGQFMVMPVFNTCPPEVARCVWNAVSNCVPPMPIDITKILTSLTGMKFTSHALVRFEDQIPTTVNLHTHMWEMRRMYNLLKEHDQMMVSFETFSFSKSASRAFAVYNGGNKRDALEIIQKAQKEICDGMGKGEQTINDEFCSLQSDFDLLSELGVTILKEEHMWKDVHAVAKESENICLGVESCFHTWQTTKDWEEIMSLCKLIKDSDCPREMFFSSSLGLLSTMYKCTSEMEQAFSTDTFEERLRNILLERMRRLPLYYSPDYVEVLCDVTIFTDLFDTVAILKDILTSDPGDLSHIIDSKVKTLVSQWRFRSCSPCDSSDVAARYYQYRLSLFWVMNNMIQKIRPDYRNIFNKHFNLTPAHNIGETMYFKAKALCSHGQFKAARETLARIQHIGIINACDLCTNICLSIRAVMKQWMRQPDTIKLDDAVHEVAQFRNMDLRIFGPDSVALYATTLAYVNYIFGWYDRVDTNIRTALALESAFNEVTMPNNVPALKMMALNEFTKFSKEPTKHAARDAFESLLMSLDKNFVKNHRHIARAVWILKSPISLSCEWLAELIPRIPSIVFLPYLENILTEVVLFNRSMIAFLTCFIGQVFPYHLIHQLYRSMDETVFNDAMNAAYSEFTSRIEYERFEVEEAFEAGFSLNMFNSDSTDMSERDGIKGRLVTVFRSMLPELTDSQEVGTALLSTLCAYQPSDARAYVELIDAIDNFVVLPLEAVIHVIHATYHEIVSLFHEYVYDNRHPDLSDAIMRKLRVCFDEIESILKPHPELAQRCIGYDAFLKPPTATNKFALFAEYVYQMEEYVTEQLNPILLAQVAPILYNFTLARAKVPDFSFQHDLEYGRCFPVIENFGPRVRFVAKNLTTWKELDVRISTGRVVTYRIFAKNPKVSSNGLTLMTVLNAPLEKSHDTLKRNAVFRVSHTIQLRHVTMVEVRNEAVNRMSTKPPHIVSLMDIYSSEQPKRKLLHMHPAKATAKYFELIVNELSELKDSYNVFERRAAIDIGIEKYTELVRNERLRFWFLDYFKDLSSFAYIRKQIATQLGVFSALHWITQCKPITMNDILIDLDYGKVFFQNVYFDGQPQSDFDQQKVMISPQLKAFLGDTLPGHFSMAAVAVAKTLLQRGFEDYVRPLIADLEIVQSEQVSSCFEPVNKVLEPQLERLKALTIYKGLPEDTIKVLINETLTQNFYELKPNQTIFFM